MEGGGGGVWVVEGGGGGGGVKMPQLAARGKCCWSGDLPPAGD